MRKLWFVVLALTIALMSVDALAAYPTYDGTQYIGGNNEKDQPISQIVRVRYGQTGASHATVVSGTVMMWDTNSADGVTVSVCTSAWAGDFAAAGVAVTPFLTDDNGVYNEDDDSWGYMAVKGYCLALVDTSKAVTGGILVPSDALNGYYGTRGDQLLKASQDCGVLLTDTTSDGNMKVYLK